jgi:hypothetical protein
MIRHGADESAVEIDLGAVGDRKVIPCEAKSSSTLATSDSDENRDTAKLITACRALTADVLATVQAECDRAGVNALWYAIGDRSRRSARQTARRSDHAQ